jgi:hypothetical protein
LYKGREVGHLHTRGACDKNDGKSSNRLAFFYPGEKINQLDRRVGIMALTDRLTNFFAVVDLELGSAMSALSMSTLA